MPRSTRITAVSAFFNILLLPLTLITRAVVAYPLASLAAAMVATLVAILLRDLVTASCLAMFAGVVLIWFDESRRAALPEQGVVPAA
jgi:hypothetical protein